jgi:hypothetical protein
MSNKKSKAVRQEQRRSGSPPDPSREPEGLGSRLKAIAVRALLFAVFLTISGYGMSMLWNRTHPPKPLHQFDEKERATFVDILKAKVMPTRSVWLACPVAKTETCQLVKQFVPMFQDAGWLVESGQVIQWKPAHPIAGVYLILYAAAQSDDAPSSDTAGIISSFTALGIPVQTASAPDVPKNSIGIYFDPEL